MRNLNRNNATVLPLRRNDINKKYIEKMIVGKTKIRKYLHVSFNSSQALSPAGSVATIDISKGTINTKSINISTILAKIRVDAFASA